MKRSFSFFSFLLKLGAKPLLILAIINTIMIYFYGSLIYPTNIMKKLLNYCRTHLSAFLSPEPEIQSDYVNKVVYLLRRDFNSKEQNEILVSIGTKLSALREKDMRQMEQDYTVLQHNTNLLKERLALS
jgi:hypothetical protein